MTTQVKVPFTDFKASYQEEGEIWLAAVERVLSSGHYVLGGEVSRFEVEFANWFARTGEPTPACVSVNSGTDAIMLALKALDLPANSEVILPANTCPPTACAVIGAGLRPLFADVEPETLVVSLDTVERAFSRGQNVSAIVPVHLYGNPAPMAEICEFARQRGLAVVEDCAQSTGALFDGRSTGLWGDLGAFSFYPTKNLGALGDGGAILTRRPELVERLQRLRFYGQKDRAGALIPGGVNSRLDEVQAAILRARLPLLGGHNARRRAIARRYDEVLSARPDAACRPVGTLPGGTSVYHLYVMIVPPGKRSEIQRQLEVNGVMSLVHYPVPLHQQAGFASYQGDALPTVEEYADRILSIPCYPEMSDEQIETVCHALAVLKP